MYLFVKIFTIILVEANGCLAVTLKKKVYQLVVAILLVNDTKAADSTLKKN